MLRILQERTIGTKRNPPLFGYFFHVFLQTVAIGLQPDVYIPHPPITMHSLRNQIYFFFCPKDTSFYPLLQKVMIT